MCKVREERGPPSTYLDNRLERSSSSSQSPQGAISLPRSKKETNESQDEEDKKKKEMKMKKREEIQEEISGSKKRSTSIHIIQNNINSNNCTSRTSRGHAYLGGGGVMPGLDGPAGVSSSSPSPRVHF